MRKKTFFLLVLAAVFLAVLSPAGLAHALEIERISGADRSETSTSFSKRFFSESTVSAVVLACGYGDETGGVAWSPDAVCAAPLASFLGSPLLLTWKNTLPPVVAEEIKRLMPEQVILVGGPGAISESVAQILINQGFKVQRIWGADRYHTSAVVAQYMAITSGENPEGAVVVTGENYADAIPAAYLAGSLKWPLLLTNKTSLPFSVRAALNSLNISKTLIVGGEGVVGASVALKLPLPERIAGKNRYETSLKAAEYAVKNFEFCSSSVFMAGGLTFADGIVASPYAGRKGICVLLVPPDENLDFVNQLKEIFPAVENVFAVGGNAVLKESFLNLLSSSY